MLASMIEAPTSTRSSGWRALTVAFVPTGMNWGVSTTPCAELEAAEAGPGAPVGRRRDDDLERRRSAAHSAASSSDGATDPSHRPGEGLSGRRGGGIS